MALVALFVAPCLSIFRVHARIPAANNSPLSIAGETLPVISDFDGDCQADESELYSNGPEKTIKVKFANLRESQLHFTSKGAGRGGLFAVDIDHDGDVDLVWVALSQPRTDVVWINDGKGNFDAAKDDSPYTAEIDALLSTDDPSDESFAAGSCPTHILTVPSPTDAALLTTSTPAVETKSIRTASNFNEPDANSPYLTYLRKRGPPTLVSNQV